ncbi:MAG TPA: hypothetical protein VK025_05960 [Steroidobacter sp.]|jgi:ribosomal protein L40E|nr:hypothetical protein [Steroidobacteraceae bacterium]HLS80931.1 hypothetical protein [Steroidobacter sp.]
MSDQLICWKCGASLADYTLPLRRLEECRKCGAELHVCRMCEWYSTAVAKHCREPMAEEVKDKERANFCDYFKPRPDAWTGGSPQDSAARARSELEALFGGPSAESAPSPADRARDELEALFGKKKK